MSKNFDNILSEADMGTVGATIAQASAKSDLLSKYSGCFGASMAASLSEMTGDRTIANLPKWDAPVAGCSSTNKSFVAAVGGSNATGHENSASLSDGLAPTAARGKMPVRTNQVS